MYAGPPEQRTISWQAAPPRCIKRPTPRAITSK